MSLNLRRGNSELKSCAKSGHALYIPSDHSELKSKLVRDNNLVRCLRCLDFVETGDIQPQPLSSIPIVLRGTHGRRQALLRVLAAERLIRSLFLFLLSGLTLKLSSSANPVIAYLGTLADTSKPLATQLGVNSAVSRVLEQLQSILHRSPTSYRWIALALAIYGLIQLAEGLGLWLGHRWAEYLTTIATALFVPLEIYEIVHHTTFLKITALVVNLLAIAYLLWKGRLFGLRGGHDAYRQEEYKTTYLFEIIDKP